MIGQPNSLPTNPLDNELQGLGNPMDDEQEIDKLMNEYTSTGMNEDKARWATAMELKNKEMANQPGSIPIGNAPPQGPHPAWGGVQTGISGAGLAAAPFTGGLSMPIAAGANLAVKGLKALFG